eukprot:2293730-Rhodomonas_salina.1
MLLRPGRSRFVPVHVRSERRSVCGRRTPLWSYARARECPVLTQRVVPPGRTGRERGGRGGTNPSAIGLRACYAMSDTGRGHRRSHATTRLSGTSLRAFYELSGTDIAYAVLSAYALATPFPVLSSRTVLCGV